MSRIAMEDCAFYRAGECRACTTICHYSTEEPMNQSMNPAMKQRLDAICYAAAEKHSCSNELMSYFISVGMFRIKLLVFGENINDKKMDTKATTRQMAGELSMQEIQVGMLVMPLWDAKKIVEVTAELDKELMPVVRFFYFGIEEDERKNEDGKIIVPN